MYNIGVIGGSRANGKYMEMSVQLGRLLADSHATVICGGLTGVMEWVSRGVREAGGVVIGILPGMDPASGNEFLTARIPTGLGYIRNFIIIRASEAVIAIDGATGTLSEAAFALSEGKSVIVLGELEIDHLKNGDGKLLHAETPEEAVELALKEAEKERRRVVGTNWPPGTE